MQRRTNYYSIAPGGVNIWKEKMLMWAHQFSIFSFFDNNHYPSVYPGYECLLATGSVQQLMIDRQGGSIQANLPLFQEKDWIFGHICYDYKNQLEPKLFSAHPAKTGFPVLFFYIPETVCCIHKSGHTFSISSIHDPEVIFKQISVIKPEFQALPRLSFQTKIPKNEYLATIDQLREHIARGDCYEINLCNEGFCEHAEIDPIAVFNRLNILSPAPFAACYRLNDSYMMGASPERYLKKDGDMLIAQPIKGTMKRGSNTINDEVMKTQLYESIKERAENVMIADLMRNDLARTCQPGTVTVPELFGIYTFPQVHQMISTITGKLKPGLPPIDPIHQSFPAGSMTGAPKHKVMQLIEQYERSARELFAGSVGYFDPAGNFDFNVVIRSLFYNKATRYLNYLTGGAITYDSIPEQEWEEMRLKAWSLEKIFS